MKKRSEVVESSKNTGCADCRAWRRALQHVEHPEGARPVFLLLSATAVACS